MYLVKIEEAFEAAHNLRGYDGKCANLHGHNWIVEVEVAGEKLNELGILVDFKDVKRELKKLLDQTVENYFTLIKPNTKEERKKAQFDLEKEVEEELED